MKTTSTVFVNTLKRPYGRHSRFVNALANKVVNLMLKEDQIDEREAKRVRVREAKKKTQLFPLIEVMNFWWIFV